MLDVNDYGRLLAGHPGESHWLQVHRLHLQSRPLHRLQQGISRFTGEGHHEDLGLILGSQGSLPGDIKLFR